MVTLKLSTRVRRAAAALLLAAGPVLLWTSARLPAMSSAPDIVRIDVKSLDQAATSPIEDTDYWKVIGSGRPPAASVSRFVSADKLLEAGVSRYERVTLQLRDWPVDEFMYIVEGQVEITPTGGQSHVFGPGDAFVMPRGFSGTWRQLSNLKKFQVTYAKRE